MGAFYRVAPSPGLFHPTLPAAPLSGAAIPLVRSGLVAVLAALPQVGVVGSLYSVVCALPPPGISPSFSLRFCEVPLLVIIYHFAIAKSRVF